MGLTTTSTRSGSVIVPYLLQDVPLKALTPNAVFYNHINHDDMDGEPSLTKRYTKETKLSPATAATEGVDFATTDTLGYDTPIDLTPLESAVKRADITWRAMRRKRPGETAQAIVSRVMRGDLEGLLGDLEQEASRLWVAMTEKAEIDCCALLGSSSTSVGSTGVDLSLATLLAAIAAMDGRNKEHGVIEFIMDPQQTADMRAALLASGTSAATWFQQADAGIVNYRQDPEKNGLRGSFLGIPWFQLAPGMSPGANAGADVVGALVCRGEGRWDDPNGLRGAHVFLEGAAPYWAIDTDASGRLLELLGIWEYVVGEIRDEHYVTIVSDAP